MHGHYDTYGPEKIPVDTFSLWALIKDSLDTSHEKEKVLAMVNPLAVITDMHILKTVLPSLLHTPPLYKATEKAITTLREEPLDPEEKEDLEEQATQYHTEDRPLQALAVTQT